MNLINDAQQREIDVEHRFFGLQPAPPAGLRVRPSGAEPTGAFVVVEMTVLVLVAALAMVAVIVSSGEGDVPVQRSGKGTAPAIVGRVDSLAGAPTPAAFRASDAADPASNVGHVADRPGPAAQRSALRPTMPVGFASPSADRHRDASEAAGAVVAR